MIKLGILIIILDGLLIYSLPNLFNDINLFYPYLTITYIVSVYGYSKKYLKNSLILGFIYDLLYSNIFLYNAFFFLLLSKINNKIFNYLHNNLFNKVIVLIINIILYDTINYLIIYFSKYNIVYFNDLVYKIINSLLLNILVIFILDFLLKKVKMIK